MKPTCAINPLFEAVFYLDGLWSIFALSKNCFYLYNMLGISLKLIKFK